MGKLYTIRFCFLWIGLLIFTASEAQVFLGTSPFTQNFDTIGSGLPNGFTVRTGATNTALGTPVASFNTATTSWFSTSGRFGNYASAIGLVPSTPASTQGTIANRALGVRQTGSFGDPGAAFVFQAVNTKGKKDFTLSFNLQSLDSSSPRTTTFLVQYAKGTSPTSFTTVSTTPTPLVTGNSKFFDTLVNVNFGNAIDDINDTVWIRIATLSASTGSSNRATSAIDNFTLSWNEIPADTIAPVDTLLVPQNGSTGFSSVLPLKIFFSEPVVAGNTNLYIINTNDNVTDTIKADSSIVSINGNVVTIAANLLPLKHYKIGIDAGAFTDFANNDYAGKNPIDWQFSTASNDTVPPLAVALSPANGASNVPIKPTFTIQFNEGIALGLGNILIKQVSNDSLVQTIPVANATVQDSTIQFSATANLSFSKKYYIFISDSAFQDLSGNRFAGISDSSIWMFTTQTPNYYFSLNNCNNGLPDNFTQYSAAGDSTWNCTIYGYQGNGIQINGFGGGSAQLNDDWLISPPLDLTGFNIPLLQFYNRTKYNGPQLKLLVSTNYSGTGNPAAATWTELNGHFPPINSDTWTKCDSINLSNFISPNTYIAWRYTSNSTDGAARTTLDNITIFNSTQAPQPTLTVQPANLFLGYAAAGTTSVAKAFQFTVIDANGTLTITAPAAFQVSKDSSTYSGSIQYSASELAQSNLKAFVRFAPNQSNLEYSGELNFSIGAISKNFTRVYGNSINRNNTIDIVNWNIEWFGSSGFGPTNKDLQEQNVKQVLRYLDADIYALLEVVDTMRFRRLIDSLGSNWGYTISPFCTNASTPSGGNWLSGQKMALVYKKDVVSNVTGRGFMLSSSTAYSNWATGRVPYLVTADITKNGVTKTIDFFIIHAKSGSTASDYDRRYAGVKEMKDSLDANFSSRNVMILGDYNDDLVSTISTGSGPVSSWDPILKDSVGTKFYKALTLPLDYQGFATTIDYPGMIDHNIISSSLLGSYISNSAKVRTDVSTVIPNYLTNNTSDHYPIYVRFNFGTATAVTPVNNDPNLLTVLGNPVHQQIRFMFNKNVNGRLQIQLMDLNGQMLQQQVAEQVVKGQVISLPIQQLPAGTYMLRVAHKDGTTVKQILKY
jgi:hypothetical protein